MRGWAAEAAALGYDGADDAADDGAASAATGPAITVLVVARAAVRMAAAARPGPIRFMAISWGRVPSPADDAGETPRAVRKLSRIGSAPAQRVGRAAAIASASSGESCCSQVHPTTLLA